MVVDMLDRRRLLAVVAVNQAFVTCVNSFHRRTVCVQVFRETVYSKLKNHASEKTVTMARMSFALVNECIQSDLHNSTQNANFIFKITISWLVCHRRCSSGPKNSRTSAAT